MFPSHFLVVTGLVQGSIPRVAALHQVHSWAQLEALAVGQQVFQSAGVWDHELRHPFAGPKIEQVIAQGEIEQFALPAVQSPLWPRRFRCAGEGFDFHEIRRIVQVQHLGCP